MLMTNMMYDFSRTNNVLSPILLLRGILFEKRTYCILHCSCRNDVLNNKPVGIYSSSTIDVILKFSMNLLLKKVPFEILLIDQYFSGVTTN